jgi:hypothetical protein
MIARHFREAGSSTPEQMAVMAEAYEVVRRTLHDRGQPELISEVIAKRIIELAKKGGLDSKELASQTLASFGLPENR